MHAEVVGGVGDRVHIEHIKGIYLCGVYSVVDSICDDDKIICKNLSG